MKILKKYESIFTKLNSNRIMSKNRRTKSTSIAGSLIPSKGPIAAQHRPTPSLGGAKLYLLLPKI